MRTTRTVYRILRTDGTEEYRGKRSAVLRKLSTLARQGELSSYSVEMGTAKPAISSEPEVWQFRQNAIDFVRDSKH